MITIHQRHRRTDGRTDRQTTCDRNTALCTEVHRAVKTVIFRKLHKCGSVKSPLYIAGLLRMVELISRQTLSSRLCVIGIRERISKSEVLACRSRSSLVSPMTHFHFIICIHMIYPLPRSDVIMLNSNSLMNRNCHCT